MNPEVPGESPRAEFVKEVETDVRCHGETEAHDSISGPVFAARLPEPGYKGCAEN